MVVFFCILVLCWALPIQADALPAGCLAVLPLDFQVYVDGHCNMLSLFVWFPSFRCGNRLKHTLPARYLVQEKPFAFG